MTMIGDGSLVLPRSLWQQLSSLVYIAVWTGLSLWEPVGCLQRHCFTMNRPYWGPDGGCNSTCPWVSDVAYVLLVK